MLLEQIPGNCVECGSERILCDHQHGEFVCERCGLVLNESMLDDGPEWNEDSQETFDSGNGTGMKADILVHDKNLATVISFGNKDAFGNSIGHKNKILFHKLRTWQKWVRCQGAGEKTRSEHLLKLKAICSRLGLPNPIRERSAYLLQRARENQLIRGRHEMLYSCIYAACREQNIPRTLKEIAKEGRVSHKKIGKSYRVLCRELGLKIGLPNPSDYLVRFCNELKLNIDVQTRSFEILQDMKTPPSANPLGVVAAVIYQVCRDMEIERTQTEISKVVGVTEVTLRARIKDL